MSLMDNVVMSDMTYAFVGAWNAAGRLSIADAHCTFHRNSSFFDFVMFGSTKNSLWVTVDLRGSDPEDLTIFDLRSIMAFGDGWGYEELYLDETKRLKLRDIAINSAFVMHPPPPCKESNAHKVMTAAIVTASVTGGLVLVMIVGVAVNRRKKVDQDKLREIVGDMQDDDDDSGGDWEDDSEGEGESESSEEDRGMDTEARFVSGTRRKYADRAAARPTTKPKSRFSIPSFVRMRGSAKRAPSAAAAYRPVAEGRSFEMGRSGSGSHSHVHAHAHAHAGVGAGAGAGAGTGVGVGIDRLGTRGGFSTRAARDRSVRPMGYF